MIKKSPKVKGSALLLRIYEGLTRGRISILCVSNRRSLERVGLETGHVKRFASGVRLLYRAGLRIVHRIVRHEGPSIIIVSSVRAVFRRSMDSTPKDISRIERSAGVLVRVTGKVKISVFVMNRIAGRKGITNPEILRRVISAILCFRNSQRTSCHVLHTIGGHFKSAGRVNIFRVYGANLRRIGGPSRCVLGNEPRSTSNSIITYSVRKAQPVLIRVRTLIYRDGFNVPEQATIKASFGEIGLLVTILRGGMKLHLTTSSTCIGVTKKVGVARPTVSLKVYLTVISDTGSVIVPSGIVMFNRINLDNRVHTIGVTNRHIRRTGGLKFKAIILPRIYESSIKGIRKVGLICISRVHSTVNCVVGG